MIAQKHEPWIHRSVQKDKLRVRERYWRFHEHHQQDSNVRRDIPCMVPDGLVWRKYLKLLVLLTECCEDNIRLVLLESAVEHMDYRNSSPMILQEDGTQSKESAAVQERSRLKKMVEGKRICAFCDLSLREREYDEWDLLRYVDMSTEERCKNALLRAGRLLESSSSHGVYLVFDDDFVHEMKSNSDEVVHILSVEELLALLVKQELVGTIRSHELLELKKRCEIDYHRRNRRVVDDDGSASSAYLSEEAIEQGLRDGSLFRGRLEVTKQNAREGYVSTPKERYFLSQEAFHFNRAIHHDSVIIRPLPESQWECPVGRLRLVHHRDDEEGDVAEASGPLVPTARVVAIADTSRRIYVATLVDSPSADEKAVFVVPMDTRIPRVRIRTSGWQRFVNQRLLVEIDGWDVDSNYPSGHCVQVLGAIGDLETEITSLLYEHEIHLEPFSVAAMACLPTQGKNWIVTAEEVGRRRDLRTNRRIFSVDPPGCQDIDDTMHAEVLPNGDIEVGVHIADVTHFVAHNSALDLEAQVRGTTFYLVDRRFDMLPTLLSGDLCSLHGGMDRLAVSVIWTMSPDFKTVKSVWYGRTVIHNCQAMTYEQAHNILHDLPPDDPTRPRPPPLTAGAPVDRKHVSALRKDLGILTKLARKLRKDREEIGGAVDLASGDVGTELKFALDENGNPIKVSSKKELEIHHTIAELMIMANQSVAEKISKAFPTSSLLRIHRTVNEDRFEGLQSALKAGGIEFDGSSNMALAQSLKQAKLEGKNAAIVNSLWQSLATRAMSEALYICTGDQEKGVGLSHYGLGIHKYTHFTSPIRRYADVVVHKQLMAALTTETRHIKLQLPPGFPKQKGLASIPDSVVISIEKGQGLKYRDSGDSSGHVLDSLIHGTNELALGSKESEKPADALATPKVYTTSRADVYEKTQVASICNVLNKQNRMAKLSSFECQRLFLSLYFRKNVEIVPAVVTDIRLNGLLVYVPKFDLKGPVFLSDTNGDIQIDPRLVGLSQGSGLAPTPGFASSGVNRLFPNAKCMVQNSENDAKRSLAIMVPDAPIRLTFRALDVVMVHISCEFSDTKARVPPPRFQLVATSERPGPSVKPVARSLTVLNTLANDEIYTDDNGDSANTLYAALSGLEIRPRLGSTAFRFDRPQKKGSSSNRPSVAGRRIFSQFVNPDTRAAQQEAAVTAASESAAQRRAVVQATVARRTEYDRQQHVEKSVTARTQKLAAVKRSAKRGKGK
jgi:VacB/RNase II family 3'-5' exoribonuclease